MLLKCLKIIFDAEGYRKTTQFDKLTIKRFVEFFTLCIYLFEWLKSLVS